MTATDKRVERSSRSTIELRKLLRNVCSDPAAYIGDSDLRAALKSQGALAKYSNERLSIHPSSINTLKRTANEWVQGGFEAVDKLRKSALERIEDLGQKDKRSNKRTRAGLAMRVNELEADVLILERVNFALLQTLSDVIKDIKLIANIDSATVRDKRSREAVRRLVAMMAINPPPFDALDKESNVIPIGNKK